MNIELLVVEACPNEALGLAALEQALHDAGLRAQVSVVTITDDKTAHARGFLGSPSFHVDGRDLFPVPDATPGLACRVYSTPAGLRGVPDADALRSALANAR